MTRIGTLLALAFSLSAAPPVFKVRMPTAHGAAVVELPVERYVAGVLAGESSVFRSDAALRAMAVAARTYAVRLRGRHAAEGYDFCVTTHCQRVDLDAITPHLEPIAEESAGELLWFEGRVAFTPYTRDCGGRSEESGAVWPDLAAPYLKSHEDTWCSSAGAPGWQWSADPARVALALARSGLRAPPSLDGIAIVRRSGSGRAANLALSGSGETVRISAGSFRLAVGRDLGWNTVMSDLYDVQPAGGHILFQGRGAGHGVGLCQRGADEMGRAGRSYREILAFYYPGTTPGVTAQGLAWQRLGGEALALWTTQPENDGSVLAIAEREARAATRRTNWTLPAQVEIRIYPDLESFRNATGEPGWVAAHTAGRRIHLQPAAVLRRRAALDETIRHELLHVLVESRAARDLPLWFREGVVGFLAKQAAAGDAARPGDPDFRQTADPLRARRAYRQAARAVAGLASRYGEATVLDWVVRGLPPEVRNTTASHADTNSK